MPAHPRRGSRWGEAKFGYGGGSAGGACGCRPAGPCRAASASQFRAAVRVLVGPIFFWTVAVGAVGPPTTLRWPINSSFMWEALNVV